MCSATNYSILIINFQRNSVEFPAKNYEKKFYLSFHFTFYLSLFFNIDLLRIGNCQYWSIAHAHWAYGSTAHVKLSVVIYYTCALRILISCSCRIINTDLLHMRITNIDLLRKYLKLSIMIYCTCAVPNTVIMHKVISQYWSFAHAQFQYRSYARKNCNLWSIAHAHC